MNMNRVNVKLRERRRGRLGLGMLRGRPKISSRLATGAMADRALRPDQLDRDVFRMLGQEGVSVGAGLGVAVGGDGDELGESTHNIGKKAPVLLHGMTPACQAGARGAALSADARNGQR